MKRTLRLFSLMAGLLLASSGATAKHTWKGLIANGDLEASDLSNYSINIKDGESQNLSADDIITEGDTPIEFVDNKVKEILCQQVGYQWRRRTEYE